MRAPGRMFESMAIITQPSAPNPVAKAMSGPNSSPAQRSITSGGAVSNSSEIAFSSSSVVSCPSDRALTDMSIPFIKRGTRILRAIHGRDARATFQPESSHREHRFQLFVFDPLESLLKPLKALAQPDHLAHNDDRRRFHTNPFRLYGNRVECAGHCLLALISSPANDRRRRLRRTSGGRQVSRNLTEMRSAH